MRTKSKRRNGRNGEILVVVGTTIGEQVSQSDEMTRLEFLLA